MELTDLLTKYPDFFPQGFSFECYDGWYNLVEITCKKFARLIEHNYIKSVQFAQIKEKFGYLRIYINVDYVEGKKNDMWHDIQSHLSTVEAASSFICEYCGVAKTDKVNVATRVVGSFWKKTLCDKCLKEMKKRREI